MFALASFEMILQKMQLFDIWSIFLNMRDRRGMKIVFPYRDIEFGRNYKTMPIWRGNRLENGGGDRKQKQANFVFYLCTLKQRNDVPTGYMYSIRNISP
jgi:hypothetical protein